MPSYGDKGSYKYFKSKFLMQINGNYSDYLVKINLHQRHN